MEQKIIHITESDKFIINMALVSYVEQQRAEPKAQSEQLIKLAISALDKLNNETFEYSELN